jgi:hypothetical protein
MPPPTGVVSGPLIAGLLAGQDLVPDDALLALVGPLDGGVQHALCRGPDVRTDAVALDVRDHGTVGNDQLAVFESDALAVGRRRK